MAPLVPRMHLFEIDDQTWFPPWFRSRVQAALTRAWITRVPVLQRASPAEHVASLLRREVLAVAQAEARAAASAVDAEESKGSASGKGSKGSKGGRGGKGGRRNKSAVTSPRPWTMIDFCAGGGGPTPSIEQIVNSRPSLPGSSSVDVDASSAPASLPTQFVLTDLHPHVEDWSLAAAKSPNIHYAPQPVDASAANPSSILTAAGLSSSASADSDARIFRMFSLAFHHFDDPLALAILRDTIENSDGFGIFELQDRSLPAFFTTLLFGLGILLTAPYYAWRWRSPMTLVFTYLIPVLPFVLVFDGWMSMLRTRTPEEVAALMQTCGAEPAELARWELRSGETRHLWPCGYLKWIICVKKTTDGVDVDPSDSATEVDVAGMTAKKE